MPETPCSPATTGPDLRRRTWLMGGTTLGALATCPWLAACGPAHPVTLTLTAQTYSLNLAAGERGRVPIVVHLGGPYAYSAVELQANAIPASVTVGFEPDGANPYQVFANDTATAVLLVDVPQGAATGRLRIDVFGSGSQDSSGHAEIELNITAAGAPPGTRWEPLPPAGVQSTNATSLIGLAAGTTGQPVVAAFFQGNRGREVVLRRYHGAAWGDLLPGADNAGPPPAAAGAVLIAAAFAVDGMDRPIFACVVRGGGDSLTVWRHEAGVWQPLGGALSVRPGAASTISRIDMVLDSTGEPVLLFNENRAGSGVDFSPYLRRWQGGAWQPYAGDHPDGAIDAVTQNINDLALALDDHDIPQVVVSSYSGTRSLRQWAWGPSGWVGPRTVNPVGSDAVFADLVIDRDGAALVAWVQTRPGANDLFLTRIDDHGVASPVRDAALGRDSLNFEAGSTVLWPALRRDRLGRIVLAWGERAPGGGLDDIRARRLDGLQWQALGQQVELLAPPARNPQLCFDAQAEPVVAWNQASDPAGSTQEIGLARWLP